MKRVIDYLMEINWDYLSVSEVVEKLKNKFDIRDKEGNEATEELVDCVIFWENHTEIFDSLEKTLDESFSLNKVG